MQESLVYWLEQEWRSEGFAMDADGGATTAIRGKLKKLSRRWQRVFDKLADSLGRRVADRMLKNADSSLETGLKGQGFAVKFIMTTDMQNAYQAVIGEQVGLIKSIASQHLSDVEGLVMRSVQRGRDLGTLSKELQARYGVTKRRAALIARTTNNQATTTLTQARQVALGITTGIWKHSHAGEVPRPEHLAADGKQFDIRKGFYMKSEGKWVMPGEDINCLPGSSKIEFSAGCKKLWRRRYDGKLTKLVTDSGEFLEATPNHPVLTGRGWVPIGLVDIGEDVFSIGDQVVFGSEDDINNGNSNIQEAFDLAAFYVGSHSSGLSGLEFHGDVVDKQVDTVDIASFLPNHIGPEFAQAICESFFPEAYVALVESGFCVERSKAAALNRLFRAPEGIIGGFCAIAALLDSHAPHADNIRLRISATLDACHREAARNHSAGNTECFGNGEFAFAPYVPGNDLFIRQLMSVISAASIGWWGNPASAEMLGKIVAMHANDSGGFGKTGSGTHKALRVVDKEVSDFSGHVYNLETATGWYSSGYLVYHNCRCGWQPVIPGFDA